MRFMDNHAQDNIILSGRDEKKGISFDDGSSSVISSDILSYIES